MQVEKLHFIWKLFIIRPHSVLLSFHRGVALNVFSLHFYVSNFYFFGREKKKKLQMLLEMVWWEAIEVVDNNDDDDDEVSLAALLWCTFFGLTSINYQRDRETVSSDSGVCFVSFPSFLSGFGSSSVSEEFARSGHVTQSLCAIKLYSHICPLCVEQRMPSYASFLYRFVKSFLICICFYSVFLSFVHETRVTFVFL